jgi:hypothetical protein
MPGARRTALVLVLSLGACSTRPLADVEPVTTGYTISEVWLPPTIRVDLLFVVDNTRTMEQERDLIDAELPEMLGRLLDPPLFADTDTREYIPVQDIHVGVVSTDMGCGPSEDGDGGKLVGGSDCGYLEYASLLPDTDAAALTVDRLGADISRIGTEGCGIEQPLEAALAALTVQAGPGRPNEGFLRKDSLLFIVFVTDEDDCSVRDEALFDLVPLYRSMTCALASDSLHPIERYVEGFRSLKEDPGMILMSFIVGAPSHPTCSGYGDQIPSCLDVPDMQVEEDRDNPGHPVPSCSSSTGTGYPPRRLVELAQAMGSQAYVHSICTDGYLPALDALAGYLHCYDWGWVRYRYPYLPWKRDPLDPCRCVTQCELIESIHDSADCPEGKDRVHLGSLDDVLCVIPQAGVRLDDCAASCSDVDVGRTRDGEGWAIGTRVLPCTEWEFSEAAWPAETSSLYLRCESTLCPEIRACGPEGEADAICCPPGQFCQEGSCHPLAD